MPRKRKRNSAVAAAKSEVRRRGNINKIYTDQLEQSLNRLFGSILPNPDLTLEEQAHKNNVDGIMLYTEMMRKDTQLKLLYDLRSLTVIAQGWQIAPADESDEAIKLAKWVEDSFLNIKNFTLSRRLFFDGIAYGYKPAEIIFHEVGGQWLVKQFKNRNPVRFGFTEKDEMAVINDGGMITEEILPDWKFVRNTWGDDQTGYGSGLMKFLYGLWFFKNNAMKQFYRFVEKFGTPRSIAAYPIGTSTDQQLALLDVLNKLQGNATGVVPDGTKINEESVVGKNIVDVFKWAIEEYVDRQFAKLILGQTLSTESKSGTHALAKFQSLTQQYNAEADSIWQQEIMDEVIKTQVEMNFGAQPSGMYPKFRIPYEDERDVLEYLQAISIAVNELGLPVALEHVHEVTQIPQPEAGQEILEGKKINPSPFGLPTVEPGPDDDKDDKTGSSAFYHAPVERYRKKAFRNLNAQMTSGSKAGKRYTVRTHY